MSMPPRPSIIDRITGRHRRRLIMWSYRPQVASWFDDGIMERAPEESLASLRRIAEYYGIDVADR